MKDIITISLDDLIEIIEEKSKYETLYRFIRDECADLKEELEEKHMKIFSLQEQLDNANAEIESLREGVKHED